MKTAVLILSHFVLTAPMAAGAAPAQVWPSQPPPGIPFAPSKVLTGITFTGRHAQYTHADTWYPSWAADGNLYSPWTDGEVEGVTSGSYKGADATTGFVTITGDDPMALHFVNPGTFPGSAAPYGGRYPAGSLVHKGIWYYGTYALNQSPDKKLNWDVLGPFVGFDISSDGGKTWKTTRHSPADPLFPEPGHRGGKVKVGAPHFVDFGRDMQYSPDGKAYLVAHGSSDASPVDRDANLSWITGDEIYLIRVTPDAVGMDDPSRYEFFAGHDRRGRAVWTHDFRRVKPLLHWDNHMGSVTVTYDAPLHRYLMAVTDGANTVDRFDTYILESPSLTGPWKRVTFMKNFGEQAYFVNFPSKFISRDGRTLWMSYSANFANLFMGTHFDTRPEGGGYWWTLQEVHLTAPGDSPATVVTPAAAVATDNPQASALDRAVQVAADTFFKDRCHVGLSVGVYQDGTAAFYNYGSTTKSTARLPTPQSLYEIASVTKTFTGALAAKAILDAKMTLDGDFRAYLVEPYPNLEKNGKPITLRTLASHTSGLTRDVPDLSALFAGNPDFDALPYRLVDAEKVFDKPAYLNALHEVTLASEPGSKMLYSNLGIKILGFGLEHVYGPPLDVLVRDNITGPLGMTHTGFSVAPADQARLVKGYGPHGALMPYHLPNAGAAGGLYSSTEDLVKYAAWQVAESDPVVRQSHAVIYGDLKTYGVGLIWDEALMPSGERKIWHSGGLYGMSSQLILFPDTKEAYALLANDGCFDTQGELHAMALTIHAAPAR